MNREELVVRLQAIGVHPSSYSFDTIRNSECVCLVNDEGIWKVLYVERDMPRELATFLDEGRANEYILRKFAEWHGVNLLDG